MYFETQLDWNDDDSTNCAELADPLNPIFRWHAVQMPLSIYYYHVQIMPNPSKSILMGTTILCGSIIFALNILRDNPKSNLFLQTPAWLNNGVFGLSRVIAVYKTYETATHSHIAECADGKMHLLDLGIGSQNINPAEVAKVTLWVN